MKKRQQKDARPWFACDNCATKMHTPGEICPRCQRGKGIQISPTKKAVN